MRKFLNIFLKKESTEQRRLAEDIELLRSSPLLDAAWYRETYADLRDKPIDVARHYLLYGAKEGRNPGPSFNTNEYTMKISSVNATQENPLLHFIKSRAHEVQSSKDTTLTNIDFTFSRLLAMIEPNLTLIATNDMACNSDGVISCATNDPNFTFSVNSLAPSPDSVLEVAVTYDPAFAEPRSSKVYVDYGNGVSEDASIRLRKSSDGTWRAFIPAQRFLRVLRFDPSTSPCEFKIHRFYVGVSRESLWDHIKSALSRNDKPELILFNSISYSAARVDENRFVLDNVFKTLLRMVNGVVNSGDYSHWSSMYDHITHEDFALMEGLNSSFQISSLFSIIIPVYNVDVALFRKTIDSIRAQNYKNYQICIADDASTNIKLIEYLHELSLAPDVFVRFRQNNGHISEASNTAIEMATGDFLVLIDQDDELPPHALWTANYYVNKFPHAKIFYSDEDKISLDGKRIDPYFKGAFDEFLLLGHNLVSHLGVYDSSLIKEIGGFRKGYEGSQDYDLLLRAYHVCGKDAVVHIPHVLYHWRMLPGSTAMSADQKSYAFEAAKKSINDHLMRKHFPFVSIDGPAPGISSVEPATLSCNKVCFVSIIIPTKNNVKLIEACINSILATNCDNYEIIIIDNGSEFNSKQELRRAVNSEFIKIIDHDQPFNFSEINNIAVTRATGDIYCFLNDDTEIVSPNWLDRVRAWLAIENVAAVGAKLLYPDQTVQHVGLHLGVGPHRVAGTPYCGLNVNDFGPFGKARLVQSVSAVTAACMFVKSSCFRQISGFDESYPIAYNDVDLCLRLRKNGYDILIDPEILVIHKESQTRGYDLDGQNARRLEAEADKIRARWAYELDSDPYINPNLSIEDMTSLSYPPRHNFPWKLINNED